jgi:DNA-binding CsgD family transcriptional regulator
MVQHALAQWIEGEGRARVLVDEGLKVFWMNPAAERLMGRPNSVLIRNGHIRSRENRFDRELRALIQDANGQVSVLCVHDAKTGENLLLSAIRLASPFDDFVGLTVSDATEDYRFRLADLHSAFGLTQTEVRVASRLLGGRTAEETAQDFGVALETVRTHIKRVYAKLGVCSREAFFHKLAPFMIFVS